MSDFQLPKLPYHFNEFENFLTAETFEYHYGRHHQTYINKLNELLPQSGFEDLSLNEVILKSDGELFNNAAQTWNHAFYWYSMHPNSGHSEKGADFVKAVNTTFGSIDKLQEKFIETSMKHFGSGYTWLVKTADGKLDVLTTKNADVPFKGQDLIPLFTCDLWEHSYYIDHRNEKKTYYQGFWDHINWYFVERNFLHDKVLDLTNAFKPHANLSGPAISDILQPPH